MASYKEHGACGAAPKAGARGDDEDSTRRCGARYCGCGVMTATAMTILLTIMFTMVSMLHTSECWEVHEGGGWKIASNQQNKKKNSTLHSLPPLPPPPTGGLVRRDISSPRSCARGVARPRARRPRSPPGRPASVAGLPLIFAPIGHCAPHCIRQPALQPHDAHD